MDRDVVHSVDSVHGGAATDGRAAEAHRVAVAFADALLALAAPVDEQLHRRLAGVAGTLRGVWEEQVRDEALFLAHRHLEELVQIVCRARPAATDAADEDGEQAKVQAPPRTGAGSGGGVTASADGDDGVPPAPGGTPSPDAAATEDPSPAEDRPDAAEANATDPDAADADKDGDDDSAPEDEGPIDTEESPADSPTAGGTTDTDEPDLGTVRFLLKNEIHSRWPSGTGRPAEGFRPQLLTPDPQIAPNRESSTDHRELARGLRLDALRLPVRESDDLHRKLAEILGTDSPPDGTRLPGFDDLLAPVPFVERSETSSPEYLHELWARLVRLLDPEDSTAVRPPHALSDQLRPLCLIVQHAMDLIAVVRESLLVPHSGLVRANGLQHITALDEPTARNWENAVLTWLTELSRLGEHANQAAGTAFLAKLTELDHALAQIIADPIPTSGSWWYEGRRQLRNGVNHVISAQHGKALATFDSLKTKDISAVATTRTLPGRVPNMVLWWLRLPYEPPGGQGPVLGQAICSTRQPTTARQLGH
ncbi:hypothetical protein [Kitasatospora sp. NPDC056184]|uniref:hypothetical protein n=1 Tax=Kitasatospora sp. NPDC056184 TaxID=3345738 RepID=UPI0035E15E4F